MLSTKEAAAILGVTDARVRALIASEGLNATKVGNSWSIAEEDVYSRLDEKPKRGRPRAKVTRANAPLADAATDANAFRELYLACKKLYAVRPSGTELAALSSREEAAFRVMIADFFLQQKQEELIESGVF